MGGVMKKEGLVIGHLSDLHLNGKADRRARLVSGLAAARCQQVDHLVLTGDLTKNGRPEQFTELAGCLAGWGNHEVTIVPGNHDEGDGFDQSLAGGSLARFSAASRGIILRAGVRLLPLDTRFKKRALAFKAIGQIGSQQLETIAREILDRSSPLILVQHHGPQFHPMHLFDGLSDRAVLGRLLELRDDVHVLSGHDHRVLDLGRVHVAASVAHHPDPLRVYRALGGKLEPIYKSPIEGNYLTFGRPRC